MEFPEFELPSEENLLIIGASGSGKSTWLQLLAGIRKPEHGDVFFDQKGIFSMAPSVREQFRNKHIGIIFQEHHFIPSLTAKENCLLGLKTDASVINNLESKAEALGLHPLLSKKPQHLSVGERQRLAILRTLLRKPRWIFADEPSSSLDDTHCEKMMDLLKTESSEINASLIVVTHDQRVKEHFERRIER